MLSFLRSIAFLVTILIGNSVVLAATPTWVSNLPLWQWYSIPNTALSSVAPSPTPLGITGPSSKIVAWTGATLKRSGSVYMLGAAGGHGDYAGNEVDALTLNTATPAWVQLHAPSANADIIDKPAQFYLDLRPAATHTYYSTQFIEARNRIVITAMAGLDGPTTYPAMPAGWPYTNAPRSFSFNMATTEWDHPDYIGQYSGGGDSIAGMVVKHQITDDIYMARSGAGWWKWTQATNTWAKLNNNGEINYAGSAIDPTRNRMLIVGDYSQTADPRVRDLNGNIITVTFGGLGSSVLRLGGYPGVVYDEANDSFLVFYNSGSNVRIYRVNASTWFVDVPSTTGTIPTARPNGIHNSVQYVPELGGIVIANSYTGNVQFMRTSSGGSPTPPPPQVTDTTAPSVPTGLAATAFSSSQIDLSWNNSTDNVGVTGYRVYKGGVQIGSVNSTSYQDTNLSSATTYSYAVAAYDAAGNVSGQSSTMSATTLSVSAPPPPSPTGTPTLLVKFGKSSALNSFGLSGWSTIIKDVYTEYRDIGPGGTTIVIGDNYTYNYQGVSGTPRNFTSGEEIRVTWYNSSGTAATFTPNISFNDPDRIGMGTTGTWFPMTSVTVPPFGSGMSRYTLIPSSAGVYSLVNVNVNYVNTQIIVADKIELLPIGSPTPPPTAPTVLLSANPSSIVSGSSSTLTWRSSNATSCTASGGWSGTKAISGSASTGSLTTNTSFTLTCTGTGGSASQSVTIPVTSSTPPPSTGGSLIISFTLTSPSTGLKPFTIGQAFRQGDVPSGFTVSANVTDFQADIKNRWPDGSARFAILSGRAALTANTPLTVALTLTSPPGGTPLTETELINTSVTASIQFGSIGTVNLENLFGKTSTLSAGRMTAGRVRTWVSGPKMSSWIYYSRIGSDAHLSAWFEVRLWSDGSVEVLPWVENSTLKVASPAGKAAATVTFTLGGAQRYSGSLTLGHHTRAVLASGTTYSHWLGADPAVTPKHNVAYLQATKLVPSYRAITSSTSSLWSRIQQTYTPLTAANIPYSGMGAAGYAIFIGPIPEWDVAYLTGNGDSRALASVIVNTYAAGGFDIHFRDETTNQPPKFSSYPNLVIANVGEPNALGVSSTNTYTPDASGTTGASWDTPHHPSLGYMAYLLLGRFYFLEETQFVSTLIYLQNTNTNRQTTEGVLRTDVGALTTRGAAWAIRSLLQSATITPDGETLQTEFLNSWQSNINFYHTTYVAQPNNPQGWAKQYSNYNVSNSPYYGATWMEDFLTFAWGYGNELQLNISAANKTKLAAVFAWKAQSIVGRFGGTGSTEYYFADAAQYVFPVAPSNSSNWDTGVGPWYADFGATYTAIKQATNPNGACTLCGGATNGNLRGGNFPDVTSYWGNLQPALAYAVQLNATGALTGYNRMIGAGNWSTFASAMGDNPVWSVAPLTSNSVTPPPSVGSAPNAPTNLRLQ